MSTDIVQILYSDRVMITVTQNQKLGAVVGIPHHMRVQLAWFDHALLVLVCLFRQMMCQHDATATASTGSSDTGFSMQVLLGRRDDEIATVFARNISKFVASRTNRPLLLTLSLKNKTPETLRGVLEVIGEGSVV